jgi:hypothetical protein
MDHHALVHEPNPDSLPLLADDRLGGREAPAWVAFALLNLGIQTVALGGAAGAPSTLGLLGRCVEGLAAGAFALHAWPRVKVFRSEDRGPKRSCLT